MRLDEWVRQAGERLAAAGIEAARLEAQMLAAHVLGVQREWVLAHGDHDFPDLEGEALLQRRQAHEPLAYILGGREFFGRTFGVGPGVLVPRHETETLVEAALEWIDERPGAHTVLDLGAGSGCIAVTVALERPRLQVTGTDVSPKALERARENAERLGTRVEWILSDAFAGLAGRRFDLILTNPPYLGLHEALPRDVADFEPAEALFAGPSGLEFYELLADEASLHLEDGGALLAELGHGQADAVERLFGERGWHVHETRKDLSGTPRVLTAEPTFC
jgi:release factor glutamine methyltransferase